MFNIGFSELILILLVAFLIVGPKDLPKVARALGRGVRYLKKAAADFKEETGLDEALSELKATERDLKQTLREADPTKELQDAQREVEKAVDEAAKDARGTGETGVR